MRLSYKLSMDNAIDLAEQLAKPFESCSLKAYWDVAGYPTNGWGNLLSRQRKIDVMKRLSLSSMQADEWLQKTYPPISQDVADKMFVVNLNRAFSSVRRLVKWRLSSEQLAALIDFTFNLGAGKLQVSTLLKLINRGELNAAAEEFKKWNKAGGRVYRGLTLRRLAEYNLFSGY